MALEDITKTGPVGLKGLQGIDRINEMSNEEYDSFISSLKTPSRENIRLAGALSMGKDYDFSTGQNIGESRYDSAIISQDELENISEYRASEQSWYDQLANGVGKAIVLAGTTFLDSTVGTIVGATSAIAEQKFSNLWNNPISRAMLEVNEWSEKVLPNYYSEEEQRNNVNGEWYKNIFTSNFWGDKFLKNMGFTMGAMGSGVLTGGALKGAINTGVKYALGKQATDAAIKGASAFVRANVGAAVASIGESKIEALHSANDWYDLQKAKLDDRYAPVLEGLEQYKQEPELYNSLVQSINEEYELELAKLNDLKAKVGNVTFGLNMPITYGTNLIAWGKLLSGGYNTAASSMNISKRLGKYVSDTTPIGVVTGSLAEGTQEISQKAAATIPGLKYEDELEAFYNSNTDNDATEEAMSWMKAFAKGISDTVSDPNSWEEFTLGALTKVFGTPMIRRNDGKLSISLEGSIVDDYREYKKQKDLENSMVDALNSRIESEDFKNYYDGITRHIKYQNDMNESAENKDAFAYKNAEDSQLISDIIMFDKAGRLNDLVEMINDATELSDENIQSIIENTTDADGNGPFSQNGNALPREEIINKINERKDNILKQINIYRGLKDAINREVGDKITEEQLGELTWLGAKSARNTERLSELSKELRPFLRAVAATIEQETPEEVDVVEGLRTVSDNPIALAKTLKENPELIKSLKEGAKSLDEDYNLGYEEQAKKLDDVIKLYDSTQEFNKKYKEYLENPSKQAQDKAKSKEKAAKINEASENIKRKDNIANKSVSEINKALDNGELNEDDLLDIFPDGLPDSSEVEEATESESKVKTALDIRDKTNKIKAEIDKSDADDTTKNNAKKLIDNSKLLSDSLDDLTDLSSEAFNDPSFMYDELDSSLQGLDMESLQDELEVRLGGAKSLLSEVMSIVEDNEGKLDKIPDNISDGVRESSIESTGHDSVDKNEPINTPKKVGNVKGTLADNLIQQAMDESNNSPTVKTIRDVIKDIDRLVSAGAIEKTIKKSIYNSTSYKKAVEGFPGLVQAIDNYISDKLSERDSKTSEAIKNKDNDYNPALEDDIITYKNSGEELEKESNNNKNNLDKTEGHAGIYTSWLSPLSKYYRYSTKGDRTTFDQVAEGMNYSPEKLKRVKAIWGYLDRHNAFDYVTQGNVKAGDKIEFAISQALNEEAGELVIILRKDDHVVGVLPSSNDKEFNNYAGLSDFVELIKNEYESLGSPISFTSKYTTSVNKNMVGRVPYTSDGNYYHLNTIFTNQTSGGSSNNIPFELGISSGDGRNAEMIISSVRKGTSETVRNKQRTIMSPLDSKKGKPYLLLKTSDPKRAYFPVPFIMPTYSQDTSDSALGKAIDNVLSTLTSMKAKDIMKVKREIQELLVIPELHINILKNGNLKIDAKFQGEDKQTNIYNGKQDNPNLVQEVKSKLYGTPFQVSRKYINDTYKGQDYNRMIGELAYTNIDGTHTIDDWFTINPVDKEGNEFKGKTFKSTRNNPNSAKPKTFEYTWKGIPLKVDLDTFEVIRTDTNAKVEGANADKVKAIAYGFKTSKSGTYQSPWGWFNSETLEFVDEPKQENVIKRTLNLEEDKEENKEETYRDRLEKAGVLKKNEGTGFIKSVGRERVDGPLTILQMKFLRASVRRVLENPNSTWDNLYNAIRSEAHETAATASALAFFREAQQALKEGKISIEDFMQALEESFFKPLELVRQEREEKEKIYKTTPSRPEVNPKADDNYWRNSANFDSKFKIIANNFDTFKVLWNEYKKGLSEEEFNTRAGSRAAIVKEFFKMYDSETSKTETPSRPESFNVGKFKVINKDTITNSKGLIIPHYVENGRVRYTLKDGSVVEGFNDSRSTEWKNNKGIVAIYDGAGSYIDISADNIVKVEAYDPVTNESILIGEYSKIEQKESNTFSTPEQLEEQARKKGLLGNAKRKALWKVLDASQQESLLNIKGLRQSQLMSGLERAFNVKNNSFDMSKLGGSIENYLGIKPLYRRVIESKEQIRDKEIKWLSKALPNLSEEGRLKVVNGLIEISARDGGGFAWGQFKQGIIEISNQAARGTVYHEAFHAVTHTLLDASEYEELFKAGRERYGNLSSESIEEKLAEDFRIYMQLEEMPFVGRVVKIFRTLKHIIQNLLGNEAYLNKLYYNINNGNYANRELQDTNVSRNMELTPARFQEIVNSVVNNSTHTIKGRNNEWGKFVDSWKRDGIEVKGYRNKNNKYIVTSVNDMSEQSYYRRLEQYHREKYMLGNLSNEDKQYLIDRGISIEEYNRMSQFEREVLFHCK